MRSLSVATSLGAGCGAGTGSVAVTDPGHGSANGEDAAGWYEHPDRLLNSGGLVP